MWIRVGFAVAVWWGKKNTMCTPASITRSHINVLTATKGVMAVQMTGPLSHCILPSIICKCQLFGLGIKATEQLRLWGQRHWLKCLPTKRMAESVLIWAKQSTGLFKCKWIYIKKRRTNKGKALQHSGLNVHDKGCIYLNSFVNVELNFCCDYSVEGFSNSSPCDLSVSWKVKIWIGRPFFRHCHSVLVQKLVWKGQSHTELLLVEKEETTRTCLNLTRKSLMIRFAPDQFATYRFSKTLWCQSNIFDTLL